MSLLQIENDSNSNNSNSSSSSEDTDENTYEQPLDVSEDTTLYDVSPPATTTKQFYGGLNYIAANGHYPQLHINNIIARFTLGVSEIKLPLLAMRFGTTVLPLKYGSQCSTKRKLTLEIRKRSNEWYCKTPTPLTGCTAMLQQHKLYDELYHQCLQRDRLNSMRRSIVGGNYEYKIVHFMEPWAPQCTLMLYAGGKCSVSGIRSEDQGLAVCWSFVRLLSQRCGIPAMLNDFEIRNIACDTRLDYDVDLDRLAQALGDLAEYKPRKYPACVVYDSHESQSLVSLVYPNGNVVETGAKTYEEAEARHRRMVDKCAEFKIDDNNNNSGTNTHRSSRAVTMYNARANRLLSAKMERQRQHRLKVAQIIQRMVMREDEDDNDDDDDANGGEKEKVGDDTRDGNVVVHRIATHAFVKTQTHRTGASTTAIGAGTFVKRSIVDKLEESNVLEDYDDDDDDITDFAT